MNDQYVVFELSHLRQYIGTTGAYNGQIRSGKFPYHK